MTRIIYTCKNCGWKTSILSAWADLKPKRCMNRDKFNKLTCNTSFLLNPELLLVELPKSAINAKESKKILKNTEVN